MSNINLNLERKCDFNREDLEIIDQIKGILPKYQSEYSEIEKIRF